MFVARAPHSILARTCTFGTYCRTWSPPRGRTTGPVRGLSARFPCIFSHRAAHAMPHSTSSLRDNMDSSNGHGHGNGTAEPKRIPNRLILCFDGTGNKFEGNPSDTNIVKLLNMFDRAAPHQMHYYQRT